jgi:hypothetical protein
MSVRLSNGYYTLYKVGMIVLKRFYTTCVATLAIDIPQTFEQQQRFEKTLQ